MARDDLLSLSGDDLGKLATRGRVNAARKELEDGRLKGELSESPDGAVTVSWADGRSSTIPASAALGKGRCGCGEPGVCKHLVALVLLYQAQTPAQDKPPPPTEPWDPGAIADEELARHSRSQSFTRARQMFDEGILAELVRGTQPLARFHVPVCTVRFLVPGEPGYARCNCARPAPCEHVALAVWAFRLLPTEQRAGIVTAGSAAPEIPVDLLDAIETHTAEFIDQGVSGSAKGAIDRLSRLARRCEEAGLIWPAEILGEWLAQLECYQQHDARFDPARIASLVGELTARIDALRTSNPALPPLLVRGSQTDRPADLEPGEYWGLGCVVRPGRRGVEMVAYLYDRKAGGVVAITHDIVEADRPEERVPTFAQLGERIAVHGLTGATYRAVGAGVLKLAGGKRTARHELRPGRAAKGRPGPSLGVQDRLVWEEIEPPVYFEDYGDLQGRLSLLPPSCLRPRRVAEDFHVLRVANVEDVRFDHASHLLQAILLDAGGRKALLEHPYTTRGRAGVEALRTRLSKGPGQLRFAAGSVRRSAVGLVVRPAGLVWEESGKRSLLQPWIERESVSGAETTGETSPTNDDSARDFLARLSEQLGELLVLGLTRMDVPAARAWADLARAGESIGFARLGAKVKELANCLEHRAHTLQWDARAASGRVLELAVLARLSQDV